MFSYFVIAGVAFPAAVLPIINYYEEKHHGMKQNLNCWLLSECLSVPNMQSSA